MKLHAGHGILLAFVAPVLLAFIVLKFEWFEGGATSGGVFLDKPLLQQNWQQGAWQHKWAVFGICDAHCDAMQSFLARVKTTLGQYQSRVVGVAVGPSAPSVDAQGIYWQAMLEDLPEGWSQQGTIFVMDPMGQVMLMYPAPLSMEEALAQGKAVKSDLYKMLKLSRVG
ncbi:hypothetical protein [Echinimonas agarilytica]|uniref:Cytochrome oxidase Cu insertion factor, SCO1/SenC/PrrC family n=1 Tax=Echinimonas agarilytica TaxID=1215918 RepID=A0AA41W9J2_9GAMM|nr:hypothetical protein [Echinimonas agarilytica]MCM2680913.1 hypothetical protein [Echinimonas agarilytica]